MADISENGGSPADSARPGPRRINRTDRLAVAGFLALAAALCLTGLTARSIWIDEAVAVQIARTPGLEVLMSDGGNMAAYYLFLRAWLLLGDGMWMVRLPSVLFSAVGLGLFYLLARRWFDRPVALTAAALLAVNSSFVYYSQEARSYTMELMLVVACWLVLAVALDRQTARWFVLWGLVAAMAIATQLFAVFIVAAQVAFILPAVRKGFPRGTLAAGLATLAAGAAPFLFTAATRGSVQIEWIPPTSIAALRQVLLFIGGNNFDPSTDPLPRLIEAVVLAVCAFGWYLGARRPPDPGSNPSPGTLAVTLWLALPLLGALIISVAVQPLLVPRFFIALIPPSCLLLALAVHRLPVAVHRRLAAGLLILLGLSGVVRSYGVGDWGWREVAAYLSENSRPEDRLVILPSQQRLPLDYYLERLPEPGKPVILSPRARAWQPPDRTVYGVSEAFLEPSPPDRAAAEAGRLPRFWVVTSDFTRWDGDGRVVEAWAEAGSFFRALGPGFRVGSGHNIGRVGVLLMERSETNPATGQTG